MKLPPSVAPLFSPGEMGLLPASEHWLRSRDGDLHGLALYDRHYSCYRYQDDRIRRLFVGPGEKLVLVTAGGDALFVWRKFQNRDPQDGVNCAVFRNEGKVRSSDLILEAMDVAWVRWPGERFYTYIDAARLRSNNPGYCFLRAGWRRLKQTTQSGKRVLEVFPSQGGGQ